MHAVAIKVYKTVRGEWRWRMRDGRNHLIVGASSEGYKNRKQCVANMQLVTGVVASPARGHRGSWEFRVKLMPRGCVLW